MSKTEMIKKLNDQQEEINNLKMIIEHFNNDVSSYKPVLKWKTLHQGKYTTEQLKKMYPIDDRTFYFITQTFDRKFNLPSTNYLQQQYLEKYIDEVTSHHDINYCLYCIEPHEDGVLHAHIMILPKSKTDALQFQSELRAHFTNQSYAKNKHNSDIKSIKHSIEDINNIRNYIIKDPVVIREYGASDAPGEYTMEEIITLKKFQKIEKEMDKYNETLMNEKVKLNFRMVGHGCN